MDKTIPEFILRQILCTGAYCKDLQLNTEQCSCKVEQSMFACKIPVGLPASVTPYSMNFTMNWALGEKGFPLWAFNLVLSSFIYTFLFLTLIAWKIRNSHSVSFAQRYMCLLYSHILNIFASTVILMSNRLMTNTCNAPRPPKQPQPQLVQFWNACQRQ